MDPQHWRDINELFHAALERDGMDRDAFLAEACGEDAELRANVERLVRAHQRAVTFIGTSVFGDGGGLLAAFDGLAAPGRHIGPYKVVRELGRGVHGSRLPRGTSGSAI